ncbi:MAG: hypothetical protein LBR47_02110 [Spirochaetaceae bacterium]|jgi:hypothetical protein|nr:hypothetical protein [Spirochaetaceae bacterium]
MKKHIIRNAAGLIVLYSIIIFGIFALQFRNESVVRKTIGKMRFTVSIDHSNTEESPLKNNFQLVYNNLDISFNDSNPVKAAADDGGEFPVSLRDIRESENSVTLEFDRDISIVFLEEDTDTAPIRIRARIPEGVASVTIPYGFRIAGQKDISDTSVLLTGNAGQHIFSGARFFSADRFTLTGFSPSATYEIYKPAEKFTLARIEHLPKAAESALAAAVTGFRRNALAVFKQNMNVSVTENTVIAYIAEMGFQNGYQTALNAVPASFRTGDVRTYYSAPYFNSLVRLNEGLIAADTRRLNGISAAVAENSLSVFEYDRTGAFLIGQGREDLLLRLLEIPLKGVSGVSGGDQSAALEAQPTPVQAAGIMRMYAELSAIRPAYAQILEPVLPQCEEAVTGAFIFKNEKLYLSWEEGEIFTIPCLRIAQALISYGKARQNHRWSQAGYLLINSLFDASEGGFLFEEYLLAADTGAITGNHAISPAVLYPLLIQDNTWYPHELLLPVTAERPLRAWTAAQQVDYERNSEGTITISVRFPQNESHYMIISNVEPFSRIQIYGVDFRTDPRFESYNSSGYVYNRETKTLLLKLRHRETVEQIRLIYN